jgi:hypothetical protein
VRNLSKWWKLGALVAVAAGASIGYVVRSRAFTLIELQYLGPLELLANQTVVVNASNTSTESVEATVDIYDADGSVKNSKTMSLAAGTTPSVKYTAPAGTSTNWIRARVSLGTANAVATDIGVLVRTAN